MKTAILMSVYNGKEYIIEQLDSIRLQSEAVNEVTICDDKSTDNTPQIISDYIKNYNLNWNFIVNTENVGWKKNFYNLINTCDADLIFLADQDDIWNLHKIEIMKKVFVDNPEINLLVSNYENQSKISEIPFDSLISKTITKKISIKKSYLYGVPYPGCSYCFKKEFFNKIKKYHREFLPHDAFIYRNALLSDSLYCVNQKLLLHRIHGHNAGSSNLMSLKNSIQYYIDTNNLLKDFISENIDIHNYDYKKKLVESCDDWLQQRGKFYSTKKYIDFIKLGKYIFFYPYFKTYLKEILVANKG